MPPEYDSVAELRDALSADDADRRAEAYGAVMAEDVQVSAVLDNPPQEAALRTLRQNDIVPDDDADRGESMRNVNERIVELLEDIRDELQDDVVAQDGDAQ